VRTKKGVPYRSDVLAVADPLRIEVRQPLRASFNVDEYFRAWLATGNQKCPAEPGIF
jgi:hypothetical protein